jgi:hypothetical protein
MAPRLRALANLADRTWPHRPARAGQRPAPTSGSALRSKARPTPHASNISPSHGSRYLCHGFTSSSLLSKPKRS